MAERSMAGPDADTGLRAGTLTARRLAQEDTTMNLTNLAQASEATVEHALGHWRSVAKAADPSVRAVAYAELAALDREIERRRALSLWHTGAFPGTSTFFTV